MLLVSRIAFLYASLLATWSTCVSFMWNVKVWAPPFCFFAVSVVLFSIHVVGHFPVWKHWYQAHTLGHHVVAHPVQRFTAPLYSTNIVDRYGLNRWLYIAAGSVTALGSWFWLTEQRLVDLISLLVLPGIGMWFEEFIHREIHIQKSSLERFVGFWSFGSTTACITCTSFATLQPSVCIWITCYRLCGTLLYGVPNPPTCH